MTQETLDRVCAIIEDGSISRSALARAAGLHPNSLRDCGKPAWNPTAETVRKLERYLVENDDRQVIVPITEIIEEARNGRMYILVDDEDRENEGDLIIPAQMATPQAINFMATHGRGLICLALTKKRVDQLGLGLMSSKNRTRHETAFTISIEAREGVTTGISAADRARTVSVAIDSSKGQDDIVTPGHVFPLVSREGGVLVRAGHTEASVDISRLAGLNESAVICEIMNEDGSMSRMDDLITFAREHDIKIGTIRDLIAYRGEHDRLIERRAELEFESNWGGKWKSICFYNKATRDETVALVKGRIDPTKPTLVRMHLMSLFPDVFDEVGGREALIRRSMEIIAEEGTGVFVLINRPVPDYVSSAMRMAEPPESSAHKQVNAEQRDYGAGAQILSELGVHDMVLLTNTSHSLVALEGYGLSVVGEREIDGI